MPFQIFLPGPASEAQSPYGPRTGCRTHVAGLATRASRLTPSTRDSRFGANCRLASNHHILWRQVLDDTGEFLRCCTTAKSFLQCLRSPPSALPSAGSTW
eukprot:jgi/Botrbrau1/17398/Bobra.0911s0005.1